MDLGLGGARVLVQGGTSRTGRAVARLLAAEGARLVVTGRSVPDGLVDELTRLGSPEVRSVAVDLSSPDGVERSVAPVDDWPHLNAVITVVGPPATRAPWHDVTPEDWEAALRLGVLVPVATVRAALPRLRAAPWARVVTVGAQSARVQGSGLVAYSAAKAALASASKTLSIELAAEDVLVNVVSPGAVMSPRLAAELRARGEDPADSVAALAVLRERHEVRSDLGRVAEPEDVARTVVFLASRAASHVTGANLPVDGGSAFPV